MIPEITTEIGGKTYYLRFSARTTIAIEREFNCKIMDLPALIGDNPDVTTIAKLVKLCMRDTNGNTLTDAEFDRLLDYVSVEDLGDVLMSAMGAAAPSPSKSSEGGGGSGN